MSSVSSGMVGKVLRGGCLVLDGCPGGEGVAVVVVVVVWRMRFCTVSNVSVVSLEP